MKTPLTMEEFIQQIPKAELHLHIEGTLEPELMFALAKRNNIKIPFKSVEEVHEAYKFQNLQSFLNIYYAGMQVLVHEQDFYDLTWAYLQRAKQQNICHVEIFFDPQAHTDRNIAFKTAVTGIHKALEDAEKQLGITSKLILCFLRDQSADSALKTLEEALPFKQWIIGVGLDSAEMGNPPEKFTEVFAKARQQGFLTTAHSGEEGPPDYIWQALDLLKVKRVDHGVHCVLDPRLVDELVKRQIPLTVCPLSNIKLRVYKTMGEHPIKQMLSDGLCVTVNSDDPAYFGGYVNENFLAIQKTFGFSKRDIYQFAKNSFTATFLSEDEKKKLMAKLDGFARH